MKDRKSRSIYVNVYPPVETADKHGLLALGGNLSIESLISAYSKGIFVWPFDEEFLAWFCPPKRALIFCDEFHLPTSLRRELKRKTYEIKVDHCFKEVIEGCRESNNRKGQRGTWITPEMCQAFTQLHQAGFAHSFAAFRGEALVGGIYGVSIGSMFAAESMFYREPNASKVALVHLIEFLREHKVKWLDVQVLNPFTASLGAREIPRAEYLELLATALKEPSLFPCRQGNT